MASSTKTSRIITSKSIKEENTKSSSDTEVVELKSDDRLGKIHVVACSLIRKENQLISEFVDEIIEEINTWSTSTNFGVFPEYCWRGITRIEVETAAKRIIRKIKPEIHPITLVLGSAAFERFDSDDYRTNNAIIINSEYEIDYVPKTAIMEGEKKRNQIMAGFNTGILYCYGIKVAIVICADLWNAELLRELLLKQDADLLLIPALTVVPKNMQMYAKTQWYSLAIVRSREFVTPIVIADHIRNSEKFDVGDASCIADPSLKNESLKDFKDFLVVREGEEISISYTFDMDKIQEYRIYRLKNGLLLPY